MAETPNKEVPQFKKDGLKYLQEHLNLSTSWEPDDPMDIGTYGVMNKRTIELMMKRVKELLEK